MLALLALALLQQPAAAQSPVSRIVVTPPKPEMVAGDTLRLRAEAVDAAGKPVANVRVRFAASGGGFEGEVDSLGLVRSGATGTIPVSVVATVPGARPLVHRVEAYEAGFRAFDISGDLRGDLRAQGREMGHVNTADMDGTVQNASRAWGVIYKNGLAYVNDNQNGLWIIRMEPKPRVVP